jgi:Family of unknown function (DUF5947)
VSGSQRAKPLAALSRFVRPAERKAPVEKCEMCSQELASGHSHVVNLETRSLMCACRACFLLFTQPGAAQGKYKAVPDRYLRLESVALAAQEWDSLQVPVGMAFFFFNSALDRVSGFYPSPAGATESLLPLDSWRELARAHPAIETIEADVEALLIRRGRDGGFECFLVPIDACYELTGIVRRRWRGFDGGEEARRDIDAFFGALREKSRPAGAAWPS